MSTKNNYTKAYAAGTTTTLFTIRETSNTATNILIKILAINDDNTNIASADVSYILIWNGTAYTSNILSAGNASAVFTWNISGTDAVFQITPTAGSPAGNVTIDISLLPNIYSTEFLS